MGLSDARLHQKYGDPHQPHPLLDIAADTYPIAANALQFESCPATNEKAMAEKRLERDNSLLLTQLPTGAAIDPACQLFDPTQADILVCGEAQ